MEQHQTIYKPLFAGGRQTSWRTERAALFPSDDSLRWWLRFHRDEAVRRGGLILVGGRWVATPELDGLVREIGQRQARQFIGTLNEEAAADKRARDNLNDAKPVSMWEAARIAKREAAAIESASVRAEDDRAPGDCE